MKNNILKFIVLVLIALVIFFVIRIFVTEDYEFKLINFEEYTEKSEASGINIIYVSGGDYIKEEFDNVLLKIFSSSKENLYKLDVTDTVILDKLLSNQKFIEYFESNDRNVVLPILVIYKDGTIIGMIEYSPEEQIIENLKSLEVSV
ncbi:MAG: hypothetical protein NC181_04300 [Clostridium sp.]|nr:hypothetical protein [Clostridium sp.]MCM1444433.1 hypothetical protein [Candidatus Amulumruptor caecigallinarius]